MGTLLKGPFIVNLAYLTSASLPKCEQIQAHCNSLNQQHHYTFYLHSLTFYEKCSCKTERVRESTGEGTFVLILPEGWSTLWNRTPVTEDLSSFWLWLDSAHFDKSLQKKQLSLNSRAKDVNSLVNQRDAGSAALKHVWDDGRSIPCNYCPSPLLYILSDHQEYYDSLNVSCWKKMCVWGQERERVKERTKVYIPPPWV